MKEQFGWAGLYAMYIVCGVTGLYFTVKNITMVPAVTKAFIEKMREK